MKVITGGRNMLDMDDTFERSWAEAMRPGFEAGNITGEQLWSALANIVWVHEAAAPRLYSFRAAGAIVAEFTGEGDYIDWYCSGPEGVVSDYIASAMKELGWTPISARDFGID